MSKEFHTPIRVQSRYFVGTLPITYTELTEGKGNPQFLLLSILPYSSIRQR
jgi:hypothetical protein